jgi:hypothetical protein
MIARRQTYEALQVCIDGETFIECTFKNCTIVYSGLMVGQIQGCRFEGCHWKFAGPARNALDFLGILYSIGDSGKEVVEGIFREIRRAKRSQHPAGSSKVN